MDRTEHAEALRAAMGDKAMRPEDLAATLDVSKRTIGNWTAYTDPVMPNDYTRAQLRKIFPGYDAAGDPVEVALAKSKLAHWRQQAVIAEYQRHIYEQDREDHRAN